MNKLLVLSSLLVLVTCVSCDKDRVTVISNNDRVSMLEARADLNDVRDAGIAQRVAALEARSTAIEGNLTQLQSDFNSAVVAVNQSLAQLQNTDQNLANDITTLFNEVQALQAADVLSSSLASNLAARVDLLEARLDVVEGSFPVINDRLDSLDSTLTSMVADVQALQLAQAIQNSQNNYVQSQIAAIDYQISQGIASIQANTQAIQSLTQDVLFIYSAGTQAYNQLMLSINSLQPSTQVVPFQLCAGDTAQYPEQGLKINGATYAVYYGSFNGAMQSFLAKLPAGTYQTTNGSACTFTVL